MSLPPDPHFLVLHATRATGFARTKAIVVSLDVDRAEEGSF
jgi:hypothetical protein